QAGGRTCASCLPRPRARLLLNAPPRARPRRRSRTPASAWRSGSGLAPSSWSFGRGFSPS
ncbi:hypothetical protein IWQ56_002836, partial [Coemansia nantahalensis]